MSRSTSWRINCDRCGDGETHPEPLTNDQLTDRGWYIGLDGDLCGNCEDDPDEDVRPITTLDLADERSGR